MIARAFSRFLNYIGLGVRGSFRERNVIGTTCGLESIKGKERIVEELIKLDFKTVLDVGCGAGDFFSSLDRRGRSVDGVGVDMLPEGLLEYSSFDYVKSNFLDFDRATEFDLVYSAHTIEHVQDTGIFLAKFFSYCKKGGHYCIIWPPPKKNIVGGHLHVFNVGLMLYNIVRMGIDCKSAKIYQSGYNLCIIGPYELFSLPDLTYNKHELSALADFFPFPVKHNFNGDAASYIKKL